MRTLRAPYVPFVSFVLVGCLTMLSCATVREIRIHNVSDRDFTDVRVAGERFGDVDAGRTTAYRKVELGSPYAALELQVEGRRVTGQTLNFGSSRITYRIDVENLAKGQLNIEPIRD